MNLAKFLRGVLCNGDEIINKSAHCNGDEVINKSAIYEPKDYNVRKYITRCLVWV